MKFLLIDIIKIPCDNDALEKTMVINGLADVCERDSLIRNVSTDVDVFDNWDW